MLEIHVSLMIILRYLHGKNLKKYAMVCHQKGKNHAK